MENQKLRVYWREVDENGNEIERGVDDREYINHGSARNRGYKLFGNWGYRLKGQAGIEWRAATRDPWGKYTGECECWTCGQMFIVEEHPYHIRYPKNADSVHLYPHSDELKEIVEKDGENGILRVSGGWICPHCSVQIYKFITGLRKGE